MEIRNHKPSEWRKLLWNSDIPSTGKLLALAVSEMADYNHGDSAHPGNKRLARMVGKTEQSVRKTLKELRAAQVITRTAVNNRKYADEYQLSWPYDNGYPVGRPWGILVAPPDDGEPH